MKLTSRNLVTRVALTTALSVVVASACVALISELIADRLARTREDTTLRDAADTLALELKGPDVDPRWVTKDETRELAHAGIRVAVFDGQAFLAGDRALVRVPPGTCRDIERLRTCTQPAGVWFAVVARDQGVLREQQRLGWFAAALAVLLTSGFGALGAVALARVVTGPLARLRLAVEQVPEHNPGAVALGEASDLVEVDALRESLRAAFVRLGAALTQSRRFASDAAHELRTPLATLIGELELTAEQDGGRDPEGIARALKLTQRMSTLVDRLLILARLDELVDRERIEVEELVEEAIETLAPGVRSRVVVEGGDESGSIAVDGDRALLVATLLNAVENGLKFSSDVVRVRIGVAGARVIVSVVDLGPGVKDSERELVFAPFYRTAESRSSTVPGHGIGLALITHVMALHGGSVRFVDCERGAQLEMSLPLARGSSETQSGRQ